AATSSSRLVGIPGSERQLHPRRQTHARGEASHLLLRHRFDALDRIVDRRGNQILEHVAVLGEQIRVDLHALDAELAVHRHLDHSRPRLSLDLAERELLLRLLHALLHLLRLLHQACDSAFHHDLVPCCVVLVGSGWIDCGRMRASNSRIASLTNGSSVNVAVAWSCRAWRARRSCAAMLASPAPPMSTLRRTGAPSAVRNASDSLS